jgi:hypothetical protein
MTKIYKFTVEDFTIQYMKHQKFQKVLFVMNFKLILIEKKFN